MHFITGFSILSVTTEVVRAWSNRSLCVFRIWILTLNALIHLAVTGFGSYTLDAQLEIPKGTSSLQKLVKTKERMPEERWEDKDTRSFTNTHTCKYTPCIYSEALITGLPIFLLYTNIKGHHVGTNGKAQTSEHNQTLVQNITHDQLNNPTKLTYHWWMSSN